MRTQVDPRWLMAVITQALPWITHTVRDAGSLHMFHCGCLEPRHVVAT